MTDVAPTTRQLASRLCPWLMDAFAQLQRARAGERLSHAWLLAGPAGVGKINLALVMAEQLLNAGAQLQGELPRPAATAAMAVRHEPADHHPDLHWVFPAHDKRTISVEQIRQVTEALRLTGLVGYAKVVVLEPAEAMTLAAANALLKTLEEPTEHTYLFLISHQPGRLPATIRSRCQLLAVPRPDEAAALPWLSEDAVGEAEQDWRRLLQLAHGSPLIAATLCESDYLNNNRQLEECFKLISQDMIDPQTVAEAWVKDDLELALSWLATRLQWAIRARMAPEAWNPITDLSLDTLHNAWDALTLETLFDRLQRTEALLDQIGRGIKINAELAVRVLLLGFRPRRG